MKLSSLAKLAVCGAGAVCGVGVLVDDLLVHRKFELPEALKTVFSGTDMSETRVMADELTAWLENYGYERVYITNKAGHKLTGYLMRPAEPSDIYVFCSHGYRCNAKREFCGFVQYYLKRGCNVLLVDHRAAGESEGTYIGFGYYESQDSLQWLDYLNDTYGKDISIIIHGVSMGSATVMLMSGNEALPENVRFIVADCGFTSAWDEFEVKLQAMKIPTWPLLPFVNAVNKRVAGYDFKTDTDAVAAVKKAKVPMLFVHGTADGFVPCDMVYQVYAACGSEYKDLMLVEGAQHAGSVVTDPLGYEAKLDEMMAKFVPQKAD